MSTVPTLPIKNRNNAGTSARTPKKGGGTSKSVNSAANKLAANKKWADYTPSPWVDYSSTPWGVLSPMSFGQENSHVVAFRLGQEIQDMLGGPYGQDPATPTPTAWPATPTPSGLVMAPPSFGIGGPMMPPMPMVPIPQLAAMAEAAAAAAQRAAAAANAASLQSDGSPEDACAEGRGHWSDYDPSPPQMLAHAMMVAPASLQGHRDYSKGSAMHGTGQCRPCAWFWKPQGCQCAEDCNYCHLCPEGELKSRKKIKVAAMRSGFAEQKKPPGRPAAGRSQAAAPRNLRLSSLL